MLFTWLEGMLVSYKEDPLMKLGLLGIPLRGAGL